MKEQLGKQIEAKNKDLLDKKEATKKFDIELLKNAEKYKSKPPARDQFSTLQPYVL